MEEFTLDEHIEFWQRQLENEERKIEYARNCLEHRMRHQEWLTDHLKYLKAKRAIHRMGRSETDNYDSKGNWIGNVRNENGWTP